LPPRRTPLRAALARFNPTLVRFCHTSACSPLPSSSLVSIPPWFDFAALYRHKAVERGSSFNPTLVRFCPRYPPSTGQPEAVSIPPWFDFAV
jgi:hypothetical protein